MAFSHPKATMFLRVFMRLCQGDRQLAPDRLAGGAPPYFFTICWLEATNSTG
jgi:hypothetical protein